MAAAASIRSGSMRRSWSDSRLRSAVRRTGVYWLTLSAMFAAGALASVESAAAASRPPPHAPTQTRFATSTPRVHCHMRAPGGGLGDEKLVSAAFEVTLAGDVALGPAFARVGLGLLEPLALEADEGHELLVLLFRQGVRNAGDQPFDQCNAFLQCERSGLVHQRADRGMVHPVSRLAGRHESSGSERRPPWTQLSTLPGPGRRHESPSKQRGGGPIGPPPRSTHLHAPATSGRPAGCAPPAGTGPAG